MRPSLVIFDCDGVLVESERITNEVESAYFQKLGLRLSPTEARALFKGKQVAEVVSLVESRLDKSPNAAWPYDLAVATARGFVDQLKPVPGVRDTLELLSSGGVEMCVASQAPPARTQLALDLAGLAPFFGPRIFTAFDVSRGKPHPDLFLHAAATLGHAPSACAVVEDSAAGVKAAVGAGMQVFGYAADSSAEELSGAGAIVFEDMAELHQLLEITDERSGRSVTD
jgi:HAD superfamily hydrolase (TIGR01509 family)